MSIFHFSVLAHLCNFVFKRIVFNFHDYATKDPQNHSLLDSNSNMLFLSAYRYYESSNSLIDHFRPWKLSIFFYN